MSNKLFAGPWVGEFGWEVFAWQAYVRKIAENYDHVTVCSRPDRKFLYEDFINDFVPFIPSSDASSMWACYGMNADEFADFTPPGDVDWLDPRKVLPEIFQKRRQLPNLTVLEKFTPPGQKFIQYRGFTEYAPVEKFDIVIHAANRTDAKAEKAWAPKNWPIEHWNTFVKAFSNSNLNIACVGRPDQAHAIEGVQDLRGLPLREVANILGKCRLCVGCSDGLLNFAALCGTPRLIWSPGGTEGEKNIDRHTRCWNPFNAPAKMLIHKTWQIPPEIVIKAAREMLYEFKGKND